jgi:3-oxoacyl-[acyl-carrier protein] reductase
MSLELTGRRALVTGGTRGIGRAVTLALARSGARVVACHRQQGAAADDLARELKEMGGDHRLVTADVSQPDDVARLAEECRTCLGGLDILVSNAGTISHHRMADLPLTEWRRVIDTSLTGAFLVTQQMLPLLDRGSSVIYIGSASALVGLPERAHYTAAKAGLIGLTRSLAKELGPSGIRVNLLAPGVIETDKALPPERRAMYEARIALGRLGQPEEIAGPALFLASHLSSYLTGTVLTVDGGI